MQRGFEGSLKLNFATSQSSGCSCLKAHEVRFVTFCLFYSNFEALLLWDSFERAKLTSEAFKIVADKQNEVILSSWPFKIAANGWAEALAWNFDEKFQLI